MKTKGRGPGIRVGFFLAAASLSYGLVGCGAGSSGGDGSVELTFTSNFPENNPHSATAEWFMQEVTERSDGRVSFAKNYLETLCPAAEQYQCVTDGRADLAVSAPSYEPQKFPVTLVTAIPFLADSNDHSARAFQSFYDSQAAVRDEYEAESLVSLGLWTSRLTMGGKGDPWETPSDMEGKDIRGPGGPATTALAQIGANPVTLTSNEVYEALQRGVIDGYAVALDGVEQLSLYEQSDFIVDPLAAGYAALNMVMNADIYDSLPEDVRGVIDEVSSELPTHAVETLAGVIEQSCTTLLEKSDAPFVSWDPEAAAEWQSLIEGPLRSDWEATASEGGVDDPAAVYDAWEAALAQIDDPRPDAELECAARFAEEQ